MMWLIDLIMGFFGHKHKWRPISQHRVGKTTTTKYRCRKGLKVTRTRVR